MSRNQTLQSQLISNIAQAGASSAFTLIELMMVIAIIGILAAIATPSYRDYVYSAKLAEGYTTTESITKSQITFFYENKAFYSAHTEGECDCAPFGGGKTQMTLLANPNLPSTFPVIEGSYHYFSYDTMGGTFDSSGAPDPHTEWVTGGNDHEDNMKKTAGDIECAYIPPSSLGISAAPNRKVALTYASASLKKTSCSMIFQTLITNDQGDIQISPLVTIRE